MDKIIEIHKEKIFAEKGRIERLSRIREFVFGTLDGLLVPVGVVSAVAGGTGNTRAVIVAGLAEAFAGALSMGAGEFISGRSEAQVHQKEVQKEFLEIKNDPVYELKEMAYLFELEGIQPDDAATISGILNKYDHSYKKTMVEKELGINVDPQTVQYPEAITIGISYIVGSIFPLIAYFFFPVHTAIFISLLLTILALVIVGIIKGKLAQINMAQSILEIVIVGIISALGGYVLGSIVPHLFGL